MQKCIMEKSWDFSLTKLQRMTPPDVLNKHFLKGYLLVLHGEAQCFR